MPEFEVECRVGTPAVGLETTLLLHGIPQQMSLSFAKELFSLCEEQGAIPALAGIQSGAAIVGLDLEALEGLLQEESVPKVNTANLGLALARKTHGATTVSTTMELLAAAKIPVFATGGIGGVHPGYGDRWDISADLAALSRFPVAVVASGVKSILDVESTREALETLGVPVIGFQTDIFPAFYLRDSRASVDARFDDVESLASFIDFELKRTGRGILIAHPIPEASAISPEKWEGWMTQAKQRVQQVRGRETTPALLAALHEISGGETLSANLALVRANTVLASRLAVALQE
jgi:pseudouridine-5'-phosphate glycosidase